VKYSEKTTYSFDMKNQKEAQQVAAGDLAKAQRENVELRFRISC
jgi:hypothetical protein